MNVIFLPVTQAGRELLRNALAVTGQSAFDPDHPGCIYELDFDQLALDVEADMRAFDEMDQEYERFEAWRRKEGLS